MAKRWYVQGTKIASTTSSLYQPGGGTSHDVRENDRPAQKSPKWRGGTERLVMITESCQFIHAESEPKGCCSLEMNTQFTLLMVDQHSSSLIHVQPSWQPRCSVACHCWPLAVPPLTASQQPHDAAMSNKWAMYTNLQGGAPNRQLIWLTARVINYQLW